MLQNIRIVLVETSHSGNIGSVARVLKTMGLSQLYLVNPLVKPDSHAISLAAGASDILKNAILVSSLDEALQGCRLVVGTSARSRELASSPLHPRKCGEYFAQEALHSPVALVFGRERIGLTNLEMQKCHYHVTIPTDDQYSSLNLAMAVQVLTYEIRYAWLNQQGIAEEKLVNTPEGQYPRNEELEYFYQHLEKTLLNIEFIHVQHPGKVMSKLRRLFNRARIEKVELNILRGILSSIDKQLGPTEDKS